MRNFNRRTALITGGAGGIGLGMALAFARAGMKIALADVSPQRLATALEMVRGTGAEAMSVLLDVTDRDEWHFAVDAVEDELGPVALLCNNAGIGGSDLLAEADPARWRLIVETNLFGPFHGCRTLLPRMLARGEEAHIINTASLSGLRSNAGMSAYDASKHGLVGMSDSLRAELRDTSVGISVLYPGTVKTGFTGNSADIIAAQTGAGQSPLDLEVGELLKSGADAESIGEQVLRAVLEGCYHIHTHPHWRPLIQAHFDERVAAFGEAADPAQAAAILASLNQRIDSGLRR